MRTKQEKHYCTCATCGHRHTTDLREIAMYKGLAQGLWAAYIWCRQKGTHEFSRRQVNQLMGQVAYSRFVDWVYFGGLVYKQGKGHYGLNMERCEQFFTNKLAIPTRLWKDPITKSIVEKTDYKTIREIPNITEFLDSDHQYIALYKQPAPGALL